MKKMFLGTLAFVSILTASGAARAEGYKMVDDLGLINLRVAEPETVQAFSYPGMPGRQEDERYAPDCLVLVFDRNEVTKDQLKELVGSITVMDGRGENGTVLQPKLTRQHLVFPIKDLGTYMTFLKVKTKSGEPLGKVVNEIVGRAEVSLQVLRGCRVLK